MEVRELLMTLQQLPQLASGENELRRLYFMIRNRAQKELLVSAAKIYDGRHLTRSPEGERELLRIRQFLAGYPPLTLQRGDPGYPEWNWYYEDIVDRPPYTNLQITKRRR
jgi:hypothetical protein